MPQFAPTLTMNSDQAHAIEPPAIKCYVLITVDNNLFGAKTAEKVAFFSCDKVEEFGCCILASFRTGGCHVCLYPSRP